MIARIVPIAYQSVTCVQPQLAGSIVLRVSETPNPDAANPRRPQHPAGSPHGVVGEAAADPSAAPPTRAPAHSPASA
jgi:hypothetical protein